MAPKGKSWRCSNPGDILKRLIDENTKAGKHKLLALFLEEINGHDGKGALDSVAEYWFDANYDRLNRDRSDRPDIGNGSPGDQK